MRSAHLTVKLKFARLETRFTTVGPTSVSEACNATLTLTKFSERCGVHAKVVIQVLQLAACCGTTAFLPADPCLAAEATCARFAPRHTCPRETQYHGNLMGVFYIKEPAVCQGSGALEHLVASRLAFSRYANISRHPVCANISVREDAVYAHVRSGDIFKRRHFSWWPYQQPPVSFFLNAWRHSGKRTLVVIAEDRVNPVVGALERLRDVVVDVSSNVKRHRALLQCASTVVYSNSNFGRLAFETSRAIEDAYVWNWQYDTMYDIVKRRTMVAPRCGAKVHVIATPPSLLRSRPKWNGLSDHIRELLLTEPTQYARNASIPCASDLKT